MPSDWIDAAAQRIAELRERLFITIDPLGPVKVIDQLAIAAIIREEHDQASGWQKIKTAPKDGTRILVVTDKLVEVAWWGTSNCWIAENGGVSLAASHWQPLPTPPGASDEEA